MSPLTAENNMIASDQLYTPYSLSWAWHHSAYGHASVANSRIGRVLRAGLINRLTLVPKGDGITLPQNIIHHVLPRRFPTPATCPVSSGLLLRFPVLAPAPDCGTTLITTSPPYYPLGDLYFRLIFSTMPAATRVSLLAADSYCWIYQKLCCFCLFRSPKPLGPKFCSSLLFLFSSV